MKKKLKVLVDEGFNKDYERFLSAYYDLDIVPYKDTVKSYSISGIDLVLFTGGSDVNPELYGEPKGSKTVIDAKRDKTERLMFEKFYHLPKLGICRGSQFLTVMNGGKLVQHVNGHATGLPHRIQIPTLYLNPLQGRKILANKMRPNETFNAYEITSTHHQMMFPYNLPESEYNILGWSTKHLSNTYLDGEDKEIPLPDKFLEPEIVYYPRSSSLCIQGHPEFQTCSVNASQAMLKIINALLS